MSQFNLLQQRRFLPLFLTQLFGAFNDNVYKNALVIFIAFQMQDQLGGAAAQMVVIAGGIFILPYLLFSSVAGALADRYEKSMLIRRIKLAEIGIMTLGGLAFGLGSLPLLLLVLFLMGMQSTLFGPLKYCILPQHLKPHELVGGNGLIQSATYLSILVGTSAGGLLIASAWGHWPVSITVLVIALCGWWSSRAIPHAPADDPQLRVDWHLPRATWQIVHHASQSRVVLIAILGISWFWFVGATLLSLVPSYVSDYLQGNEQLATLLLTAFSIGIGIGSLTCERLGHGRIDLRLSLSGALLMASGCCLLGGVDLSSVAAHGMTASGFLQLPVGLWILSILVLIGAAGGLYIVPLYALLQRRSDEAHRARTLAANNVFSALFMVGSALLTTALLRAGLGIPEIYVLLGVCNALVLLLLWRSGVARNAE